MGYRVVHTKQFIGNLRDLAKQGKKGVVQKIRAAMTEAGTNGEIVDLPRTKWGESRLSNVEKFELGDGHRLVVQLIDGINKARAFLFAGTHDEAERWLDGHRNYTWVERSTDGALEFVQVSDPGPAPHFPADRVDLDSPESLLTVPLLRDLAPGEWNILDLTLDARNYAQKISAEEWQQDPEPVWTRLNDLVGYDKACTVIDLLQHASERQWNEMHSRIELLAGRARIAPENELALAMARPENSEQFITFDDPADFPTLVSEQLVDWMLFLHPEQKKLAFRDYAHAARLRGISGSGKTCVLVHRARYLAKRYGQRVLVVTLTESMKKLLRRLLSELCGAELSVIEVQTISALAKNIIEALHPRGLRAVTLVTEARAKNFLVQAAAQIETIPRAERSGSLALDPPRVHEFLRSEIEYVRGRLAPEEYDRYLDAKSFRRRGRGAALSEDSRRLCLSVIREWDRQLSNAHAVDQEGLVIEALRLVQATSGSAGLYRCVLADEVQDLSQLDVRMLAELRTPEGLRVADAENGLFLVGDGAQSIFGRGFTLRSIGVDVVNRSFVLKKNYRNTIEILRAAFGLVERYEFADVDEDNIARPTTPEYANRHGETPLVVRCRNLAEEAGLVASMTREAIGRGIRPGQVCIISPVKLARDKVAEELRKSATPCVELREDVDFDSDNVKISTIESAKGHEFSVVFICALVSGAIPRTGEDDLAREAARLYVAMTRARDCLYLSYNAEKGPSPFLVDVQAHCQEMAFIGGRLVALRECPLPVS
jgi:superfamily I DNA/RNA helicase